MFEKEIKFIVDYTLNKLRKEVAHVNMGRLLNSSIHPSIIKYCAAEIDSQIRSDRNKLLTDSFFDYSGKEISRYFNLMTEEIRNNYKMKSDDLKKLIIKAVSFNANYVIRPGWTLSKFIFNDEKERSLGDILNYFNYIYYYDYQVQVLSAFIQKRKSASLSREEFVLITNKIDRELVTSNQKEILSDGIASIADFFNEGALSKDKITPYLIEYYFKDKKFTAAAEAVKNIYGTDDKQKQPVKDIIARLSAALKEEIILPEKATELKPLIPANLPAGGDEPVSSSGTEDALNFTLQDMLNAPDESPVSHDSNLPAADEDETPVTKPKTFSYTHKPQTETHDVQTNQTFKFRFREDKKEGQLPGETPEKETGADNYNKTGIFSFLSKRDLDRIIQSVFNDDQNEFASAVEKITSSASYEEAAGTLKKVFITNKVNPYSKDAVMLTSAVANYFNQE